MKSRPAILLSSCLGFLVGFAVCPGLNFAGGDEPSNETGSPSADRVSPSLVVASPEGVFNDIPSEPTFFGRKESVPRVFVPDEEWKVTIWYQSLPPQRGSTYDPREYVARRMGLTNR